MVSWLRTLAIPSVAIAALAFGSRTAHADPSAVYSSQIVFSSGGSFAAVNGATPTNGGAASVSTLSFGGFTLTYTGEANTSVSLTNGGNVPLGAQVPTTFGFFTSNATSFDPTPGSDPFTLNIFEWQPLTTSGSFAGSISGDLAVGANGNITLQFNSQPTMLLPNSGGGQQTVSYMLGDTTFEQITPNLSPYEYIQGSVSAVPESTGTCLTLFGILCAGGLAMRKRRQIA